MATLKRPALFRRTRLLESQIDQFLDRITEASLIFLRALKAYLKEGHTPEFDAAVEEVRRLESRNDELRRGIETQLYEQTLIPDLRADVLSLLEDLDNLMGVLQANCFHFAIEKPEIPLLHHKDFKELGKTANTCVDCVVMSARAFFRNIEAVRDHNAKVMFYETEADKVCTRLKTAIFESSLPLERKTHLRYFVDRIDDVANKAEDIADYVAIYAIKRSL